MKLVILGGGGFRVPLVHEALLANGEETGRSVDLVLHDPDRARLDSIVTVLRGQASVADAEPAFSIAPSMESALEGADFVFLAIRVGGLEARSREERACFDRGMIGQETTGAAGVLYGLRTLPVALRIAESMKRLCPQAWLINFTNPVGMVSEAMASVLHERVIGICDSSVGLCRRVARALGRREADLEFDYVGLNHLGWLNGVSEGGQDLLPRLLGDEVALNSFEAGRLFGVEWLRALGSIPNEYLYYYYKTQEVREAFAQDDTTRGEFLATQQSRFYDAHETDPLQALALWEEVRRERELTYMTEGHAQSGEGAPEGGYEGVALAAMNALWRNVPTRLILNVANGTTIPGLPADSFVEVMCDVDESGARPRPAGAPSLHQLGLMASVKSVERDVIEASRTHDPATAWRALATHPLVDSTDVVRELLASVGVWAEMPSHR